MTCLTWAQTDQLFGMLLVRQKQTIAAMHFVFSQFKISDLAEYVGKENVQEKSNPQVNVALVNSPTSEMGQDLTGASQSNSKKKKYFRGPFWCFSLSQIFLLGSF